MEDHGEDADRLGSKDEDVHVESSLVTFVKLPLKGGSEIIPDRIVKFSAYAESEMKFVYNVRSAFHIAQQYFTAESNFTCRKTNFVEKSTCECKCFFLVGEDGFEPSKRNAADLQSVPFGHSGTPPYEILSDWSR